ncbi:MAG TPA: toll/interleukin-1 receptor domain-containing protein [Chloroflexia bacterium]
MELTREQNKQFYEALLDAFPTFSDLSMLAEFELGVNLYAVAGTGNLSQAVFELISWARSRGRLEELIAAAYRYNKDNHALKRFVEEVGSTAATTAATQTHSKDSIEHPTDSATTVDATRDKPAKTSIFVSYSHKDKKWLDLLQTHLKPLIRSKGGAVSLWDDTSIQPGAKWRDSISQALAQAQVAVLLVSPDFLASDFIATNELPQLLQSAEKQGLTIIWVPVRPSAYRLSPIGEYQAAYSPARPLSGLSPSERDTAMVEIAEKIGVAANARG